MCRDRREMGSGGGTAVERETDRMRFLRQMSKIICDFNILETKQKRFTNITGLFLYHQRKTRRSNDMAKSRLVEVNEKIAEKVVGSYKKIEEGVVGGYKKIEEAKERLAKEKKGDVE